MTREADLLKVAEFLKERDEALGTPDAADPERMESAKRILGVLAEGVGYLEDYPFAWLLIRPDGTPHTIVSGPPGPVVGPDHLTKSDRGIGWKSRPLYFAAHDVCEVCGGRVLPSDGIPVPPIPAGVYYSGENNNFYDTVNYRGMGQDFYRQWRDRRSEFPMKPVTLGPIGDEYLSPAMIERKYGKRADDDDVCEACSGPLDESGNCIKLRDETNEQED